MAAGGSASLPTTIFDVATHRHIADVVGTPVHRRRTPRNFRGRSCGALGRRGRGPSVGPPPGMPSVAPGSGGFSPDGRFLTATDQDDNAIRVFDVVRPAGRPAVAGPLVVHVRRQLAPRQPDGHHRRRRSRNWQLDAHAAGNGPRRSRRRSSDTRTERFRAVHARRRRDVTVGVSDKEHIPRVRCDLRSSTRRPTQRTARTTTSPSRPPQQQDNRLREHARRRFTLWDRASGHELSHVDTGVASGTMVASGPAPPHPRDQRLPPLVPLLGRQRPRPSVGRRSVTAPAGLVWYSPDRAPRQRSPTALRSTRQPSSTPPPERSISVRWRQEFERDLVQPRQPDAHGRHRRDQRREGGPLRHDELARWTLTLPTSQTRVAFVERGAALRRVELLRQILWDTATVGERFTHDGRTTSRPLPTPHRSKGRVRLVHRPHACPRRQSEFLAAHRVPARRTKPGRTRRMGAVLPGPGLPPDVRCLRGP